MQSEKRMMQMDKYKTKKNYCAELQSILHIIFKSKKQCEQQFKCFDSTF